ncbi:MAG: hypothetical protein LBC53_10805 [Spirochaetaceae bacterium]|jgi:hypothetical protein|nr:hypothetical protein [Spirochaetaceae bacterium]
MRFKSFLCFFFALSSPCFAQTAPPAPGGVEDAEEIFSWKTDDAGVSVFLSGFWSWNLTGEAGVLKDPYNWLPASTAPLLFTQEADLNITVKMMDKWFVEGRFSEDAKVNSYRAYYSGASGEFLQYAGLGNTGINFPSFPYLNAGSSTPSSIGAYMILGGGDFKIHALFRYDGAFREEKTFYGGRERFEDYAPVSAIYRGASFLLPHEKLKETPIVYLEDASGSLLGSDGRFYKKALSAEAAASAVYGLVELGAQAKGRVAVSYPELPGCFSYASDDFLIRVKEYFLERGPDGPDVSALPQPGGSGAPVVITVDGKKALLIYEKGAFSPFERQSRYAAPRDSYSQAALVDSLGARRDDFSIELYSRESILEISEGDFKAGYAKRMFELRKNDSASYSPRSFETMWPLAGEIPFVYINGEDGASYPKIKFTAYSEAGGYAIGSGALQDSIQVTRNGLAETEFSYDPDSGIVTLFNPASVNETVRISFLKPDDSIKAGSFALAAGFTYAKEAGNTGGAQEAADLSAGAAAAVRWNGGNAMYSQNGALSPGTAGFGGYVRYKKNGFEAEGRAGGSYGKEDSTGLHRIAGMEGNELFLDASSLPSALASPPSGFSAAPAPSLSEENRSDLVYREYRSSDVFGGEILRPIDQDAVVVSGKSGPYPSSDTELGGNILAAEFELNEEKIWSGFNADLPEGVFSGVSEIETPFRFYGMNAAAEGGVSVFIQFGDLAAVTDGGSKTDGHLVVTKQLYPSPSDGVELKPASVNGSLLSPRSATIRFTENEILRLRPFKGMRLIIFRSKPAAVSGRFLLGRPVFRGALFTGLALQNGELKDGSALNGGAFVSAVEVPEAKLSQKEGDLMKRLHGDGGPQRALSVRWSGFKTGALKQGGAGAGARLGAVPFSAYREMIFFLRAEGEPVIGGGFFEVSLSQSPSAYSSENGVYFRARIPYSAAASPPGEWSQIKLRYGGGEEGLFVNGKKEGVLEWGDKSFSSTFKNDASEESEISGGPYLTFLLKPEAGAVLAEEGSFLLDEILLSEAEDFFLASGGLSLEWRKTGVLAAWNGFPLIAGPQIKTENEFSFSASPKENRAAEDSASSFSNASAAEVELAGFLLKGSAAFTLQKDAVTWRLSHSISRFFAGAGFEDDFLWDLFREEWRRRASVFLKRPFVVELSAENGLEDGFSSRVWNLKTAFLKKNPLNFDAFLQYSGLADGDFPLEYGETWRSSWKLLAPDGGPWAEKRNFTVKSAFNPLNAMLFGGGAEGEGGFGVSAAALGEGSYAKNINLESQKMEVSVSFPFSVKPFSASLSVKRAFNRSVSRPSEDVREDAARFLEALNAFAPLYGQAPFYSLFNKKTPVLFNERVEDGLGGSLITEGAFADEYSFSARPSRKALQKSPFVPREISAYTVRSLFRKLDSFAETLTTGVSLKHNAVNLAGAYSSLKLFPFYQNDELDSTVNLELIFPGDSDAQSADVKWKIQSIQALYFYGFSDSQVDFLSAITAEDAYSNFSFSIYWSHPAEKSLFSYLYALVLQKTIPKGGFSFLADLRNKNASFLWKEKLEFSFGEKEGFKNRSFALGHEASVRAAGFLFINAFAEAAASFEEKTEILTLIIKAGVSMNLTW